MQLPLQITLRNMEASPCLEARIRELAGRLEKFSTQVVRCQVVVDAPHHQHHEQGALFDCNRQILRMVLPPPCTAAHKRQRKPSRDRVCASLPPG
jgi:ribosome-associated translation inhibitor RaiA